MKQKSKVQIIAKSIDRPISLVGLMGSGKTHVGRQLADALSLEFFDSDAIVEARLGCSIPEIFAREGEQKFRESEAAVIAELVRRKPCIISTGGGALMNADTLAILKKETAMIWLHSSIEDTLQRVSGKENRPLLKGGDPAAILKDLLEKREPLYRQAHIHAANAQGREEQTLAKIMQSLENLLNPLAK